MITEGLVIVLSVLLALAADAAWATRGDRALERGYLAKLSEEMLEARAELQSDNQQRERQLAQIDSLRMLLTDDGVPENLPLWIRQFDNHLRYFPPGAVVGELIDAGGLEVIRSPALRSAIVEYDRQVPRMEFLELRSLELWESAIRPHLVASAPNLLGATAAGSGELGGAAAAELRALQDDPRFWAMLELRRNRLGAIMNWQQALGDAIDQIMDLLDDRPRPAP